MRVLHSSYEYPPQSTGGLGTYLEALIRHQRLKGDEVVLMYHGEGEIAVDCLRLPSFGNDGGLLTHSVGALEADVLVCHDWQGFVATSALWRRGIPLVYTCHLPLAWDIGEFDDVPCRWDAQMEFAGLLRADLIVCVSRAVETHLHRQYTFTRDRTVVAHTGVDVEFFTPSLVPGEGRVLFVGRFCDQKGFDLLPGIMSEVWRECPDATLEIMGVGPLEKTVRRRLDGIRHPVVWTEFGDLAAVRRAYRRASVVLMPSRLEPFGLVAAEAMACGRPVVAGATGGLIDIIADAGLLIDPPDAVETTAHAVIRLLRDSALCARIGNDARRRVVGSFALEDRVAVLRQVYRDAISLRAVQPWRASEV